MKKKSEQAVVPVEEFIRSRFRTEAARKAGGVSSARIFGKAGDAYGIYALENALKKMRDEGEIAYTNGLWWKR